MQPPAPSTNPTSSGSHRAAKRLRPSAASAEAFDLLCRLGGLQQKLVLPLAATAGALHARAAWFAFGYRSEVDFVREHLDRTSRWFSELVRLQHEIARLPRLASALCGADGGPTLGRKAALCIARVATPETIAGWIAVAREVPLTHLQRLVAHALQGDCGQDRGGSNDNPTPERAQGVQDNPGHDDPVEGETHRAHVRLDGPPEVRLAYDAARDLHAAVVGWDAGLGAFVEALVGEATSAGCELSEDLRARLLQSWERQVQDKRGGACTEGTGGGAPRNVGGTDATLGRASRTFGRTHAVVGRAPGGGGVTPAAQRARRILLDFAALDARLGVLTQKIARRQRATAGLALSRTYVRHLERLASVLGSLLDLEGRLDVAIADLMSDLHEDRAWRSLGFSGLEECAECLGLGASTARRRVALVRRSRRFAPVRRAYESGRLGEEAALWVTRRLEALPERTTSATPWIEHASHSSVKHLRDEEKCWRRGTLLGHVGIATAMTPSVHVKSTEAVAAPALSANPTDGSARAAARRVPLDEVAVHAALRRLPGQTRAWVLELGFGLLARIVRKGPLIRTGWSLELPAAQAADLLVCIEAVRQTFANQTGEQLSAAAHSQLGPTARMASALVHRGERLPDWLGLLGLLEEFVCVWDAPQTMPRRPYDAIYRRDGYRCMAPGCTARVRLEVHHVQYRSRGGGESPTNLLTLCRFHHQQGEHGLLAHCQGTAPLDVVWLLGHAQLGIWWRNEMRLAPRPSRDGRSVAAVVDELASGQVSVPAP